MSTKVAARGEPGAAGEDVIRYALTRWDLTARLCAIRLAEAVPAVTPILFVILRR